MVSQQPAFKGISVPARQQQIVLLGSKTTTTLQNLKKIVRQIYFFSKNKTCFQKKMN